MNEFKKFASLTPNEKTNTHVDGKEEGMGLEAKVGRCWAGWRKANCEVEVLSLNDTA